jgi:hypothetical protein
MYAPILPLLRQVASPSATAADLEAAVAALLERAAARQHPLKAAAALLRTHRDAAGLTEPLEAALMERVGAWHRARQREAAPIATTATAEYCGEEQAAAILGISAAVLRTQLGDPLRRRAYGYPEWNGTEFRFALAAVRTETKHGFLAALPEREPLEELLPDWCRRSR